jgi:ATP-dependent phosphoenolpyruvate carboxykinase
MLIRPTPKQLADFGEPDFIIYNAGQFPANRFTKGMSSTTSVEINFKRMEMVILGTEYAGEMKKGVFTVMVGHLSLSHHCISRSFLFEALPATRQVRPTFSSFFRQCRHGEK